MLLQLFDQQEREQPAQQEAEGDRRQADPPGLQRRRPDQLYGISGNLQLAV